MAELHVLEEVQSLCHGDVAVCLEQHHRDGLSRQHIANHELCQDVESKLRIGDTLDHADGNQEDDGEQHSDDHRPPRQMRVPDEDGDER